MQRGLTSVPIDERLSTDSPKRHLRTDNHRPVVCDIEMAKRQRTRCTQLMALEQIARPEIDVSERGLDGIGIEDAPAIAQIRMLDEAAVGDDEHRLIAEQRKIVRSDAAAGEFTNATVSRAHVVDADDATRGIEVVLGGIEQAAIA